MCSYHGAQIVAAGAEAKVLTGQAVQLPPAMLVLPAVHCRGEGGRGKDACMQWKLGSGGMESNTRYNRTKPRQSLWAAPAT